MGALPPWKEVDNPREPERVTCPGCGSTAVVETQNTMRPNDWPTCRKRGCSEFGQVMGFEREGER